jgi:hypothetical protein
MEFSDINLPKDSCLLLYAIHSPFYLRILKRFMDTNHTIAKSLVFFTFIVPLFAKIPNISYPYQCIVHAESCSTLLFSAVLLCMYDDVRHLVELVLPAREEKNTNYYVKNTLRIFF